VVGRSWLFEAASQNPHLQARLQEVTGHHHDNRSRVVLEPTKKRGAWMQEASRLYGDWSRLSESWDPGRSSHPCVGPLGMVLMSRRPQSSTHMEIPSSFVHRYFARDQRSSWSFSSCEKMVSRRSCADGHYQYFKSIFGIIFFTRLDK
jgi:hypothetical protein